LCKKNITHTLISLNIFLTLFSQCFLWSVSDFAYRNFHCFCEQLYLTVSLDFDQIRQTFLHIFTTTQNYINVLVDG
jgi:hypothetical protein